MPSGSWAYTGASGENAKAASTTRPTSRGFPAVPGGTYAKPTAFQGHSAGFFLSTKGAEKLDLVQQFFDLHVLGRRAQGLGRGCERRSSTSCRRPSRAPSRARRW